MKRIVSLILLSAFVLLAFAGCGSTDGDKSDTTVTTTSTFNEEEKYSTSVDDSEFKGVDIYDAKYEKTWKSEDGKISFKNNNMLGLDGRGSYEGININKDEVTRVHIAIENNIDNQQEYDGSLSMWIIVNEDGVDVETMVFRGNYIRDDENTKFTVTVNSVKNKYYESGYKKGDKIVFSQVDE